MGETFIFPRVSKIHQVIFAKDWCKDAVLVKVKNGVDKLRFEFVWNSYEVTLNGESLFSVNAEKVCPTCGAGICRGYGEQNLSMKDALEISAGINEGYEGIEKAAECIQPMLGLLSDGYYVVADSELFPYTGNGHFWENHGVPNLFVPSLGRRDYEAKLFGPSTLIASEKAALCDGERVEYYMRRLEDGERFPRAIGCYLGGDTVLLLDGHHKAAAQAARGKMVKCLVIMPVSDWKLSEEAKRREEPLLHAEYAHLLDSSGVHAGFVHGFFPGAYRTKVIREDREPPRPAEFVEWGKIPQEYFLSLEEQKKAYVSGGRQQKEKVKRNRILMALSGEK